MAELTMRINTGPNPDPAALQAWIEAGMALDVGVPAIAGIHPNGVEAQVGAASGQSAAPAAAPAAAGAARGGRKTTEQKAQERQAAEAASQPAAQPEPVAHQPQALPGGAALPPGVTMPIAGAPAPQQQPAPAPVSAPAPQASTAPAAAMPAALPAVAGDDMPLEQFREAIRQFNAAKPGMPIRLMSSPFWSDNTPRIAVFTVEGVPASDRARLVQWMSQESMA